MKLSLLLAVLFQAATGSQSQSQDGCSAATTLACETEGFETLCAAVEAAGLVETLSSGTFTIFAPTNDAFDALPDGALDGLLADTDALTNVLLFHVVPETTVYSTDLVCTGLVEMGNGKDSRTVCVDDAFYQKGAGNSRDAMPKIVQADLKVCNGVIHVVDQVMLPP